MRHKIYEATLQARLPCSSSLSLLPTGIINETQSYNEMRSSAGITNDVPFCQCYPNPNPCPHPFPNPQPFPSFPVERERFIRLRLIRGGT